MREIRLLLILFLFGAGIINELAAQDRYAVFLKFKPQSGLSLARPAEFLSAKSLQRRDREGVKVDSTDLPVSAKYISILEDKVEQILYPSKWLNAVLVVADAQKIEEIKSLPFVSKVERVAIGFLPKPDSRIVLEPLLQSHTIKFEQVSAKEMEANQNSYDFQNELIGIPEMHKAGFRAKGIVIAVFDAGFPGANVASSLLHLQVKNQILGARDFVRPWNQNVYSQHQHGTNVLSLIGSDEPGKMVAAAPDASFILVITEEVETEYRVEEYNWIKGAEFADSLGVDIINSSLGYLDFDDPTMNYTAEMLDGKTATITQGATLAAQKGILVVNSVGNYGPGARSLIAPADAKGILAVGSVNQDLNTSSFSSRGPSADLRIKPDLVTMGNGVTLIRSTGLIGLSSGTSFSAPQIAALAAGLWGANPTLKKDELIQNLLNSCSKAKSPDNLLGYGIPNFNETFFGKTLSLSSKSEPQKMKVFPNPWISEDLFIQIDEASEIIFTLIDVSGKKIHETILRRVSIKDPFKASLPGIAPGMYIVQVVDGVGVFRSKIFKR